MAIRSLIKEVALLLYIIGISQAERDLLDTIHLNADNPPEVNDFLHEVLQFQNDFRWIRRQAQESEINNNQFKKSIFTTPSNQIDFLNKKDNPQNVLSQPANDGSYDLSNGNKPQNQRPIYNLRRPIRRSLRKKRKRKRRKSGLVRRRRSKGSVNLDLDNEQDSGSEVKVVPRSETGVQNVPGQKYYGRHRKSSESSDNCLNPDHNEHNVVWKNRSANDSRDSGEYYYTSPHDVLGLAQDMVGGSNDLNKNQSCKTFVKSAKVSGRPCRNISNPGIVQQMKPINPLFQQNPPKLTQTPPSQFTLPPPHYFQPQLQSGSALNSPPQHNFPSLDTFSLPSLKSTTKFITETKNNDFMKLVNYIETPSRDNQIPSKQELLRKDSDNLLENIDHVLKADRSGLHMFQPVAQPPRMREDDFSSTEKESPSFGMYKNFDVENYNHAIIKNIMASKRILPSKVNYNFGNTNKRLRSVNKRDVAEDDDEEHVPNVELKFNSRPEQKFKPKAPTSKRRSSANKKKKKKSNHHFPFLTSDPTTSTTTMILPSAGLMFTISSTSNSMVNNPNIKLLENADDDNNKNLKMTLREYLNRENAHNLEKQQQEQEDEDNTFDYNVGQEKKIELEDLTEPTSAAEQRELGRKDESATPIITNDDTDNQFIVIPLKKQVPVDVMGYRSADFDTINSLDSFRVKDSEDVIHLGKKSTENKELKKISDLDEKVIDTDQKRNIIAKKKVILDNPSILNLENDQFYYENNQGKLSPIKQMDYNYYDNFEQKREIQTNQLSKSMPNFKGRKLQNEENYYYYDNNDEANEEMREKRDPYDLYLNMLKRSEDDEPDEEPGNDSKEPHYKQKKVQENEPLDLSPKIEETETLHIDVIDPKRRSYADSFNNLDGSNKRRSDEQSLHKHDHKNASDAIAISITTIDDFQVSDEKNGEKSTKNGPELHIKQMNQQEDISSTEHSSHSKKKSTRFTKATTCYTQESEKESNEAESTTEESKSNRDSNDQSTCILISAKPISISSEKLEKYREKSRNHASNQAEEGGDEEELENIKHVQKKIKKKIRPKMKYRDDVILDSDEADNESEDEEYLRKRVKERKKNNNKLIEERKHLKHNKNYDKDVSDDERQLVYCYLDKNRDKKIHHKHTTTDEYDYVKPKVMARRIKSKDDNDDVDADELEEKNNYDKFEKYKYDKYDDRKESNEEDKQDERQDERQEERQEERQGMEEEDDDKEVIDGKNNKDDDEEKGMKEDGDEKDDKEEFNTKEDDEKEYHSKPKKVTLHSHRKKVAKHRRPNKEDAQLEEFEPKVIYKHLKKSKKNNKAKYNNYKNSEGNDVIGSFKDDDDDMDIKPSRSEEKKDEDFNKDGESAVTVYRSKPRPRSPTMNVQDRNGTKVISTTCHLENVVTGSMGLIECLQEQAEHSSECNPGSTDETPPNEDNQETSENGDEADVKSEQKDGGQEDAGQKDAEQKDGGKKDVPEQDGEQKDDAQNGSEEKDGAEQNDGEEKDGGQKDGGQNDAEQKDSGEKDGGQNDAEQKDGGEKDEGQNDTEQKDVEPQDNSDQDNTAEVSKPRPAGEKVSAGEGKSSEPLAAMKSEGKVYELPKNDSNNESKDDEESETGGILEEEEETGSTSAGNQGDNAINYNYFNVTINMVSNGAGSENPSEEGSDLEVGTKSPKVDVNNDQELQQLTKNIIELIKKGKYCNSPNGHSLKSSHKNETYGQGGNVGSSGEEIHQTENKAEPAGGQDENENNSDSEETKPVDESKKVGKVEDITEGGRESEDTQENGDATTESNEDTEQPDEIYKEEGDSPDTTKTNENNNTDTSKPFNEGQPKKAQAALKGGHDETGAAFKAKVDQMRKKGHQEDDNANNSNENEKQSSGNCKLDQAKSKDGEENKESSEDVKSETEGGTENDENKESEDGKESEASKNDEKDNESENVDNEKESDNKENGENKNAENENDDNKGNEDEKDASDEDKEPETQDKDKKPKQGQAASVGESSKDETSGSQAAFKAYQPTSHETETSSASKSNAVSGSLSLNASASVQCNNNTNAFESAHREPLKAQSSPLREDPVEDSDLIISEPKTDKKPILIKSSTVVHIGGKTSAPTTGFQSSTQDSDDVFPQNIGEDDIKDIITSRESDKYPLSLFHKPQSLEELSEEEILENDQRNMMIKNPERNQILSQNIQGLISRYKNRFTPSLSRRDIRPSVVHHHSEKKHQKPIPKDQCVRGPGGYYDNDLLKREIEDVLKLDQRKKQTKRSDHLDDDQFYYERFPPKRNVIIPVINAAQEETVQKNSQNVSPDDLEYYHEKRIMKNSLVPVVRPAKEAYMDIESVDEDLKEKLLFQKVYDSVMRSRKKAHNPDIYKSLDEYFENASVQDDDDLPISSGDDSLDNIEIPVKRKQEYEEQKQRDENTTPDTGGGLVEVSRPRKKVDNQKKKLKKKMFDDIVDISKNSYENFDDIERTSTENSKIKLDDVESFKDVIEQPISFNSKRSTLGRQLKNLESESSYLSPILEDDGGEENIRLRRKLRNLHQFTRQVSQPPLNQIIPFNYNDYIQNHRFGQNLERANNPGDIASFRDAQTPQSGSQDFSPENEIATDSSQISTACPDNLTITKQSEGYDEASNRSKGTDDEQKKKEREDMRNMLNGDLPMNLINIFYGKLKDNSGLFNRFGGSISNSKECAYENVMNIKSFREDQAKVDIKHAEEMLHEVIVMLNRIVADQVHRKTCLKLSPNLKLYIIRITKGMRNFKKSSQIAEGYPLPKIKYRSSQDSVTAPPEEEQGHLLFEEPSGEQDIGKEEADDNKDELRKRIRLIQRLLEKYERMSMRCQVQVTPVRNYLLDHLKLLTDLLENSKSSASTCPSGVKEPKEPPISDEELAAPHQQNMANFQAENKQVEFTTILQRSVQMNKISNNEVTHRQQVLIETQQDQRKIEDMNQYISEHQKVHENPPTKIHDDVRHADKDLPFSDLKDYRRNDLNNIQVPYSGNMVLNQNVIPFSLHSNPSISEEHGTELQIRSQPPPAPAPQPQPEPTKHANQPQCAIQNGQQLTTGGGYGEPEKSRGPGGSRGPDGSEQKMNGPDEGPGNLGGPGNLAGPGNVGGSSNLGGPEGAGGPEGPSGPSGATNNPGNPAEDTTKYSYPDLVTKDLMQLGLGGANTYLPPFSVDGMVKENMMKMNNIGNPQQASMGGGNAPPNPTGPQRLSPQSLQRIIQSSLSTPINMMISSKYQPKPRSGSQEINDILSPSSRSPIEVREASTPHKDSSLKQKQRYKRVSNDDNEEDTNEEASSKIRKLALNLYQEPQQDLVEQNGKSLRSTIHSHLFNEAQVIESSGNTKIEDDESSHNTESVIRDIIQDSEQHIVPIEVNLSNDDETYFVANLNRPTQFPDAETSLQRKDQNDVVNRFSRKNTNWTGTDKYKKLIEAYESLRDKRQNEDRFSKLFATKDDDKLILKAANKQIQDISKVNFEKPLVYSLD
ncbi:uncharacterized protein PF3D7_1120600-like isoform X2 [Onthophagus taurus]|uniref:uncharacterized protein PF3D7_1120600-like isoform X2 n=1 Tax=Onthophagus taurus TaxID=166361 RepID=UPI0039BE3F82